MKKLQQYYIFKISTTILKNSKYNLNLSIKEARRSSLIVSIGDSQMLRSLRKIKDITIDEKEISELFLERKKIKKKKSSEENLKRILEIDGLLDKYLFVPEIVSILVDNITQYKEIGKKGFILNGKKYVRFTCGAGQARRNNALFIDQQYEQSLKSILNNDREDIEITPAKFSAYFSLSTSATLPVSDPYFCVVPDKEIKRIERVDFVKENEGEDDTVEEKDMEITFNLWDGQGIISPKMAKKWAEDLELDYVPSSFIVRSNFIKGLVVVIDFHKFSDEIGKRFITDIYGDKINIRDMDIILTQSQFKLWDAFSSLSDYKKKLKKNNLGWGVSRVAPKQDTKYTFLNYQFIQVLNLNEESIKRLVQPTIDFFNKIIQSDYRYTLLYLLGKISNKEYDENIFSKIHDKVAKAIILNNKLINDPYIKNNIIRSLNKKIRESYIGNILIDGSYSMMVSDPYAFLEYIFDLPIEGLLKRGEHYNKYWLSKKENVLAAMRAPLTWKSEVNILNLKTNEKIKEWYQYLDNCVVYNVFGNDTLRQSDNDWDGDLICITNNKEIINNVPGGNPVTYSTKKAPKKKIKESELYLSDINGFNSKVGFVTNVATTIFSMLPLFPENSKEYSELIKRLKCLRKEQGSTIDATKGLVIKPFPRHWAEIVKYDESMTKEEIEKIKFQNSISTGKKRPYFMRWLYSSYNKKYKKFNLENASSTAYSNFNKTVEELLSEYDLNKNSLSENEIKFVEEYRYKNPFIESNCIMNVLCKYVENEVKELKTIDYKNINEELILLLKNKEIKTDPEKIKKLYSLYKKYKEEKNNINSYNDSTYNFKTMDQYNRKVRLDADEISSNGSELANLAVDICYIIHPNDNKTFLWGVFGDDLLENIKTNSQKDVKIPFIDKNGDIEYLGNLYSMKKINIVSDYDIGEEYNYGNYS